MSPNFVSTSSFGKDEAAKVPKMWLPFIIHPCAFILFPTRLLRICSDSPDLLAIIKQEGQV